MRVWEIVGDKRKEERRKGNYKGGQGKKGVRGWRGKLRKKIREEMERKRRGRKDLDLNGRRRPGRE